MSLGTASLISFVLVFPAGLVSAPATGPAPIRIERKTPGPPVIPDVPRDQVICFALYTVHKGVLKLSAQLYPLKEGETRKVRLEVKRNQGRDTGAAPDAGVTSDWERVAEAPVDETGWLATFRVENWDAGRSVPYRVVHAGGATFEGLIRHDPVDKDEIVVAAFTCNSNTDRGPRLDIVANVRHQDPDLLVFSGDQSYDHKQHTAAWLVFGTQFRDIIRDRPTITFPDDHDIGQGNLWGQGGKRALLQGGADGGYLMPADYVNMVQRAQTSHLPDPRDPTPVAQGITVYYTSLIVGGIDFAIIEDRKWKTGPAGLLAHDGPRPDHIADPHYDRAAIDVPEAQILGERQIRFLRDWGQEWAGAVMKTVLSQTIFAGGAHIHGRHNNRVAADLDSNGWPQSGRAAALREMRRCFALHIAGDQHLPTVIYHGVNDWEDAVWSFCVPPIVNYYGRWWWPLEPPLNHDLANALPFTGRYFDGFGNKLTMLAYANPTPDNHNAAGYGLVRFRKSTREVTFECWPRHVDVTRPEARQFSGWPITINQLDNYGRKPIAYLPTLEITGAKDPVIQVIDEELNEPVYTLRIQGRTFRPKVFKKGAYTIRVGEGNAAQTLKSVKTLGKDERKTLDVTIIP
ncbi:MAG TPA: hypothetical protein VLM89_14520 [Phycisphaerae bacterium]|nr:hypothetical protein [Phycisphaerae bacterium]